MLSGRYTVSAMNEDLFGNLIPDEPRNPSSSKTHHSVKAQMQPLAERLRPQSLDEVVGQQHLLGPSKPLRVAFDEGRPHSMILWGPPGVGKTTLARLMAKAFHLPFIAISAVLSGVKEIREAVEAAQHHMDETGESTLVFVDEVHRFSKSQQDAFLPHVESGLFVFIGATTENPSFEVNSALLSRSATYVLESLKPEDFETLLPRAIEAEAPQVTFSQEAKEILFNLADGDARRFLNAVELACHLAVDRGILEIDAELLRQSLPSTLRRFDKGGDNFYDLISALHKSVRGSDPDAALYWMTRMIVGGCDPLYICRRVIRMATEDIGLADPRALEIALNAAQAYERLGSPEGELAIANAVVYCAVAPKSNSIEVAYNAVKSFVKKDQTRPVPLYLRNAPTKLMSELGYSQGYRYAHDEPDAFAAGEIYLPEGIEKMRWYYPRPRGLEIKIEEKLERLKALNRQAWSNGQGRIARRKPK